MLLELTYNVVMYSTGRLGTLNRSGMAEQRCISRMRETYPQLFDDGHRDGNLFPTRAMHHEHVFIHP